MAELPSNVSQLIHQLWKMEPSNAWFGRKRRERQTIELLDNISGNNARVLELLPAVAGLLLSKAINVKAAASRAIDRLLSATSTERLLFLDSHLGRSYRWYASNDWEALLPTDVDSLFTEAASRTAVLGLCSLHRNGYVRHEAVKRLAQVGDGAELRYLLLRTNDWVRPISQDAGAAVRQRVSESYLGRFAQHLDLLYRLLRVGRSDHHDVVKKVTEMLWQPRHERWLTTGLQLSKLQTRRQMIQAGLEFAGDNALRVLDVGLKSEDPIQRLRCCRKIAVLRGEPTLRMKLPDLLKDCAVPVRREALRMVATIAPELGLDSWRRALLDRSASIRELARYELRSTGEPAPATIYRATLEVEPMCLPALLGLVESGDACDLPIMRRYLSDPLPRFRCAAVRGMAKFGGDEVVDELVARIQDDSPAVVREAVRNLKPLSGLLRGDVLLAIAIDDHRTHVRRAALMAIFHLGKWRSLPWLVRALGDRKSADFAQELITSWFIPSLCNRVFTLPSKDESIEIEKSLDDVTETADKQFTSQLNGWLAPIVQRTNSP